MNVLPVLLIAVKRLFHNIILAVCVTLGAVVAVALMTCIPLYSDGVNTRLLEEKLKEERDITFIFHYVNWYKGPVDWTEYKPVNDYLMSDGAATIGLPFKQGIRYVATKNFRLFSTGGTYGEEDVFLEHIKLGFISGLKDYIEITEGCLPRPSRVGDPIEVLISQAEAEKLGFQVGENYNLFYEEKVVSSGKSYWVPVIISGIWRPLNVRASFWFYGPEEFDDVFLIPEQSFVDHLVPVFSNEVNTAIWYLSFDGHNIHPNNISALIENIKTVSSQASSLLEHTELEVSPTRALLEYRRNFFLLSIILYVFSIPLVGLVFYFIILISQMMIERQKSEIAILRSRGTSRGQIFGIYLLEGLIMGAIALSVGLFLGKEFARLMGSSRSFLLFYEYESSLRIKISLMSLYFALGSVALVLLASLVPSYLASRHTIVTYKQTSARSAVHPWWQRYWLDFILLCLCLYGYYMLYQRGTISIIGRGETLASPFQNPLLFLVPTLFIFALSLIFIRFLPSLMELAARLSAPSRGISMVLVLRRLARSASFYMGPLMLLVLTFSLVCFVASMARTLDGYLRDHVYYWTGADLNLSDVGNLSIIGYSSSRSPEGSQSYSSPREEKEEAEWEFLPLFEYLRIPGILKAARVGSFSAAVSTGEKCRLMGIDPMDFHQAAYFRQDYALHPLGVLMRSLSLDSRALLVDRAFLERSNLRVGDYLLLSVKTRNKEKTIKFIITDIIDFFPTVYPEDGLFFIGNLDYIFEQMGDVYPYDLWLNTEENFDSELIMRELKDLQGIMPRVRFASEFVRAEQMQPERQGFFGLLSIGYISAALLTILGFFLYSVISFQRRSIEFGLLRAIGLSASQITSILTEELLFLIGMGIAIGTGLGALASRLFIPFLQVGSGPHPQTPPFLIQIGWKNIYRAYLVFGIMFAVAIIAIIILLMRMKVFQVLKLGESL